jgi:hypothetical protein
LAHRIGDRRKSSLDQASHDGGLSRRAGRRGGGEQGIEGQNLLIDQISREGLANAARRDRVTGKDGCRRQEDRVCGWHLSRDQGGDQRTAEARQGDKIFERP